MGNTEKVIDVCMLSVGGIYSLANIEHILGIIILVIQLVWIFSKLVAKIINTIKRKENLDTLDADVGSVIGSLSDIKDSLSKKGDDEENE